MTQFQQLKNSHLRKRRNWETRRKLGKRATLTPCSKSSSRRVSKNCTRWSGFRECIKYYKSIISGNIKELTLDELKVAVKGMPKAQLPKDDINIVDFLVESGVVTSKRQAREDVNNGAISINGDKVTDLAFTIDNSSRLEDSFTVVRRGKKNYKLVEYK